MGVTINGFSVFMPYIMETYEMTNTQISSLVSIRCIVSFISMLIIGKYYACLGMRLGMSVASMCAGLAFAIYSIAETYGFFCIGAAFAGLGYGLGSMVPVSIMINRWFICHKTLALGICGAGSGMATIILPPITAMLVEYCSVQKAFLIECIGIMICSIIISLLVRDYPSEKKLKPLGWKADEQGNVENKNQNIIMYNMQKESYTFTRKQWILLGTVSLFMGALANPGFMHFSVLFTMEEFVVRTVAAAISVMGMIMTLSKIFFGQITDRHGGFQSSICFMKILLIGCCFAFLKNDFICFAAAIVLGMGYPVATIGPSVWATDLVSADNFAKAIKYLQIIYAAGALVFANLPGVIADLCVNYMIAYGLFAFMLIVSICFIIIAYSSSFHYGNKNTVRKFANYFKKGIGVFLKNSRNIEITTIQAVIVSVLEKMVNTIELIVYKKYA